MASKGKELPGPIRGEGPCKDCTERFTACSDHCPKDERGEYGYKARKAESERVNKNRRDYIEKSNIGWRNK